VRKLVLFLVIALGARAADDPIPSLSILLPPDTAKIHFFMTGPFGAYQHGEPRRWTGPKWNILTSVNGQAADHIKVIAYSADCQLMTVDLPLKEPAHLDEQRDCQLLNTITIPVQVVGPAPPFPDNYGLEVLYVASWSLDFFGIKDGVAATFPVRMRAIGRDGTLEVRVPDLARDPTVRRWAHRGYFLFFLQDRATWKQLTPLAPEGSKLPGIPVQDSYAPVRLKATKLTLPIEHR
jgi:hypothetical protein